MAGIQVNGSFILGELLKNTKPLVVLEGSSRSTKTYSWELFCILHIISRWNEKIVIRAFRAIKTDCKDTIAKDFQDIMQDYFPHLWDEKRWNKTENRYKFLNGSEFHCTGCDDAKRLKGYKQHVAILNEVMEISRAAYDQIDIRTTELVIMDFNPSITQHWVFKSILSQPPTEYLYLHSTYKDNEHLSDEQVKKIEKLEPNPVNDAAGTSDYWTWQVFGLGRRCRREGAVYTRWDTTDDWPDPITCQRHGYAIDFGFTIDPTAVIECAIFQDFLYVREIAYKKGLLTVRAVDDPTIPCIQNELEINEVPKISKIYYDKARPDQGAALRACGYNTIKSLGGKVEDGVDKVKRFHIRVHISSQNIQTELENYIYPKDEKTMEFKTKPIDKWNHAMDAIRYFVEKETIPDIVPSEDVLAKRKKLTEIVYTNGY